MNISFKNNPENEKLFKQYVKGARLGRARNISSKKIINFQMSKNPIHILVNMQGSQNRSYIINISEKDNDKFLIVHDCPDFKNGYEFCKHIVKTLLILDYKTCEKICRRKDKITFTSKISKIKQTKKANFENKAEKLIEQEKYLEAITYYERAYDESKNERYIKKIIEISLLQKVPHRAIKYLATFERYLTLYYDSIPKIINEIFFHKSKISFPEFIDSLFKIQIILAKLSDNKRTQTLNKIKFKELQNPLFLYIMCLKLHSKRGFSISFYGKHIKREKFRTYKELKRILQEFTSNTLENAILDMESMEIIETYQRIIHQCNFSLSQSLKDKISIYTTTVKELYREALHHKHAALRSLLISNLHKDKFEELTFRYNYRYENLLWSNAKKNSSTLYYFILEKCGFDKDNLNYITVENFVENYPIFLNLFGANNPIPDLVEEFWDVEDYNIKNSIVLNKRNLKNFNAKISDIDKYFLIEWDIAQKPILGSYICQFSEGYLIPERNNPLTYEIRPFDLILCLKTPINVKKNNIKILRPLRRLSLKNAIELTYEGIDFVSSYIPLNLIKLLKNHDIDEIEAVTRMNKQFEEMFFPKKEEFKAIFKNFINTKITKEFNQFYLELFKKPDYKKKILKIIGFHRYQKIFKDKSVLQDFQKSNLKQKSLQQLRYKFKKFISQKLISIIKSKNYEEIDLFELKRFPEFRKWTAKIIYEYKNQLLNCKIVEVDEEIVDVSSLANNYYGKMILKEASIEPLQNKNSKNQEKGFLIYKKDIEKIKENFSFLNIKIPLYYPKS